MKSRSAWGFPEPIFRRKAMQLTTVMMQVSFLAGVLQQIQIMPCFWLTRLVAASTVGDTMDARKAAFAKGSCAPTPTHFNHHH